MRHFLIFSFLVLAFVLVVQGAALDKSDEDVCEDHVKTKRCNKWKNQGKCNKNWVAEKCPKTCGFCSDDDEGSEEEVCEDVLKAKRCNKLKNKGKCSKNWVAKKCAKTCGFCDDDETTTSVPTTAAPTDGPTTTGAPTAAPTTTAAPTAAPTTTSAPTAAPTTTAAPTAAPTTTTAGPPPSSPSSYTQDWLRGDTNVVADPSHVHEGLRLAAGDGWVGVGGTIGEVTRQVIVRKINNEGAIQWTVTAGDSHSTTGTLAYSVGFGIAESGSNLYVGVGLWQKSSNQMMPAILALDSATGNIVWTKVLSSSQPNHGGARGVIVDGSRIIATGYVNSPTPGFQFVSDESTPAVWELDFNGNVVQEKFLGVEGLGQGAKIRKDLSTGYVLASTGWDSSGGQDVESVGVVKLSNSLDVEWSKYFGIAGGSSQCFDLLVDNDGNYLMGGHTTIGTGVVNWDYLALKVNSQTQAEEWRRTYGQPRGFDANYIHDEMYGVALDPAGNYLLLGGSGDEYTYSATNSSSTIPSSDTWVSYLVAVDTQGNTLMEGIYGAPGANNAGEYLSVDMNSGVVMIYTDSDSINGGFGFLKLSPA